MSHEFYKILHIASIVLFFSLYMGAISKKSVNIKLESILTGICLLLILVSGMGLIKHLGIPHSAAWPTWLRTKLGIWVIIAMASHMVLKRFSQHATKFFIFMFILLMFTVYLVNVMPFQ